MTAQTARNINEVRTNGANRLFPAKNLPTGFFFLLSLSKDKKIVHGFVFPL